MTTDEPEIPAPVGNLKTEYYQAYFGDHFDYYMPVMIDFEQGKKFTFNVWAFFCGLFWQLYRKLYLAILLFIAVIIIETRIGNWAIRYWSLNSDATNLIKLITIIILGIMYGYTGNYFLMRKAQKKIGLILSTENDEGLILEKLKKAGSGNSLGIAIVLVIHFCMLALVATFGK